MKQKPIFWILFISLFGAALYIHTFNYGYSGDDGIYAHFNRVTQKGLAEWTELFQYGSMNFISINPVNTSIYRPFTLLTFAIEYQIFGEFNASNGHIFNVILYFSLLVILGNLLVILTQKKALPIFVPLLILLLYAVHPIHTEVVASVKSRDTLLASLFAFSAILYWVKNEGRLTLPKQFLVGGLFLLSLISKEETITLMALVFLIAYFFQKRSFRASIKSVIPYLIPVILYLVCRMIVLEEAATVYDSKINSVLYGVSGGERLATNLFIYLKYVKLLVVPHPLSWDYSFSQIDVQTFTDPLVWISLLFFAGLIFVAVKGLKSRSLISFGILFYLATFSIFANLTDSLTIGSNLGERFLFIPSLAFCFLVVYGLYMLMQHYQIQKAPLISSLILMPFLLAFSWKTIDRAKVWKDGLSLSYSGIETAPKSWRTHVMYAEELRLEADKLKTTSPDSARDYYAESVMHFDQAYEILGEDASVSQYLAALAESLLGVGDTSRALVVLEQSIDKQPDSHFAKFKLAAISFERGDYEKARRLYLESLQTKNPDMYATYKNLGLTYIRLNEKANAVAVFEKALEVQEDPEINRNLAYLYTELGDLEKAKAYGAGEDGFSVEETAFLLAMKAGNTAFENKNYAEAVRNYSEIEAAFENFGGAEKFPSYYAAYGKALLESKDTLASKARFLKAFEVDPGNSVVLTNLGTISFLKDRNYVNAEKYFRAAVEAGHEDQFSAYTNLGTALIVQKKEREAIEAFEKSLQYGSSRSVLSNLYLLNKAVGNEERMTYYQEQLANNSNQ
ncbi:tetratricopeptide repeat protein [Algoriphagus lutimaris]|uniref:tetratricopeptide repeat protein n=1 Tax=Algoriphagus lutimaris TaxID=613197 RepID=UPI00196B227D|nr:tetratricopeptide repeat protein [Algoriphagus lutimaris]MBN3520035.1 tetratricopeptide repeat protein [Algoriphagus lutimaris]